MVKVVTKDCKFDGVGTVYNVAHGSNLEVTSTGDDYKNVGKILNEGDGTTAPVQGKPKGGIVKDVIVPITAAVITAAGEVLKRS